MAQLNYTIDSTNVYENKGFTIPAGNYKAIIDDSNAYRKENGNVIIKLTFSIIDGNYSGKKIDEYLVIEQPSEQAKHIALGKLNKICLLFGITEQLDETTLLHNKPLSIRVGIKNDDKGNPQNRIFDYMALNGNSSNISDTKVEEKSTNGAKKPSFLK